MMASLSGSASDAVPIKTEDEGNNRKEEPSDTTANNNNNFDDWEERNWCWLLSPDGKICNVIFQRRKNSDVVCSSKSSEEDGTSSSTSFMAPNTADAAADSDSDNVESRAEKSKKKRSYKKRENHQQQQPQRSSKRRRCCRRPSSSTAAVTSIRSSSSINSDSAVIDANTNGSTKELIEGIDIDNKKIAAADVANHYVGWVNGSWCWLLSPEGEDNHGATVETNNDTEHELECAVNDHPTSEDESDNFTDDGTDGPATANAGLIGARARLYEEKWMKMYRRLVAYKQQYNSTCVPRSYATDRKLGLWVHNQRWRKRDLKKRRLKLLNSIGFVWNPFGETWMEMYRRLVVYKKSHKSTFVPRRYGDEDLQLGNWVNLQRSTYKKKEMPVERINLLESVGFVWDANDASWTEKYERLVAFKEKYNHVRVPSRYEADRELGRWVGMQRCIKGQMPSDRKKLLKSIGFVWNAM